MNFLAATITNQIKVKDAQLELIQSQFTRTRLTRKSRLITAGELATKLALIESGYLRMFRVDHEGEETTVWIGGKGKFITSISSFVNQQPSFWNIEAMTDCDLYLIKRDSHFHLCQELREWQDFENLLLAKTLGALEHRTFELMSLKAEERFQFFFERNPEMFLHVPSKYIASLLGISQETLSRLKKSNRSFS